MTGYRAWYTLQWCWLAIMLVAAGLLLAACEEDPTPIVVYVTATPEEADEQTTAIGGTLPAAPETRTTSDENSAATEQPTEAAALATRAPEEPTRTPSPTVSPAPTGLPSNTPAVSPTPSPTPTVTPTPRPTDTPPPPVFENVPPAEELPVLDVTQLGVQVHPFVGGEVWDALLRNMNDLDFHWIKFQLDWSQLEPQRGQYNDLFYAYAQRVQWANFQAERPLKVLLSVAKAPDWARPPGADLSQDGPPADPNELARFITDFIRETKPQDNRIAAIEIWNEPNLDREWNGVEISGARYMEYFRVSYDAIQAIAPNITVVTAGLAPVGTLPGAVSDRDYLQQMYNAGLADYGDRVKVGVHPYGWGNPPDERCCQASPPRGFADNRVFFFLDTLYDYIDIMQRNNHQTELWPTEFGWGTYDNILPGGEDGAPPPAAPQFGLVTSEQQAEYTLRAIELMQSPPLDEWIGVAFLWNLNFATIPHAVANGQEQAGYSLLDAASHPRLIYRYLQVARTRE